MRLRKTEDFADMAYCLRNNNSHSEKYFLSQSGSFQKKSDVAVVLHLYYAESWEEFFMDRLQRLARELPYDLYVTLPQQNTQHINLIQETFPSANFFVVPNKGRDVLPFIKATARLQSMGYKKVLKLHSKKSTHRDLEGNPAESGDNWLDSTLDALIPRDRKTLAKLVGIISEKKTGMIGAYDYYYPLRMYFGHNREKIEQIMRHIDRSVFSGIISDKVEDMGFFGGTMFWVDIDAIAPTLQISERNFQNETGQTDGTIAHALERVFCILPQTKAMNIYGVSGKEVLKINKQKGNIPGWYYDDVSRGLPPVSIIVPVYADWESLSKNIASLSKEVGGREDVSVYYVNDCGPEADDLESKIKHSIGGLANFYYHRNDHNLGFVKNCNNAALKIVNQSNDILLLNSDTKVTGHFLDAMRAVLYSESDIAAVTSRSNNATIWSVPMTSRLANYRTLSYILYRWMKRKLPEKYITPTIHGFCVLIRREVIAKHGLFDEAYGKGYGEENDFAMRIRKKGWKCAVANYSYVFHYESRSFGESVRNKQIEQNEKILTARYPEYRQLVQEYWDSVKEPLK